MVDIIIQARELAAKAHKGQMIAGTDIPYIGHLGQVAGMVQATSDDPEMIATAWLLYILADTDVTFQDIVDKTTERTAKYVLSLTPRATDGNDPLAATERVNLGFEAFETSYIRVINIVINLTYAESMKPSLREQYTSQSEELLRTVVNYHTEPLLENAVQIAQELTQKAKDSLQTTKEEKDEKEEPQPTLFQA